MSNSKIWAKKKLRSISINNKCLLKELKDNLIYYELVHYKPKLKSLMN